MAGNSGDGSWQRIIVDVYSTNINNATQNYQEYNAKIRLDETVIQFLIQLIRSGYYHYNLASLLNRGNYGSFRENNATSSTHVKYLIVNNESIQAQVSDQKDYGSSVRCVAKFFIDTLQPII